MTGYGQGVQQISRAGMAQQPARVQRIGGNGVTFQDVLRMRLERESGISFSAHAVERLRERNIGLDSDRLARLSGAVARVDAKGGRDSLVMMDDAAYIVSVKNRTVVTVMSGEQLKGNVFTNIDSTVVT